MAISQIALDRLLETMVPMDTTTPYFRGLFYGESGVGKTLQATGIGNKILYIEADPEGWVTLLDYPTHLKKCTRMVYAGLSQLDAVCDAIEGNAEGFEDFDCIVIDTLSHVAVHDLDIVLASRSKKDPNKDPNVPAQPDYLAATERVRRTVTRILKLPIHVVMTSHSREDKDEATGRVAIRPSFTPKLRKDVERMCHVIGYMTAVETEESYKRKMQVHPTRNIAAKSRIGGLPVVLDIDSPDAVADLVNDWLASGAVVTEDSSVRNDSEGLAPSVPATSDESSVDESGLEI